MLTDAQKAQYLDEGYLVLPGFRRPEALAALRERAAAIVDAFEPQGQGTVFTTRDQARTADAYFLASADRIHCFFEEEAFGPDGMLCRPKPLAINKIGHALHDLDPVFDRFSRGADLAEVAADLGLLQPQVWQSMLIFKQPGIGGEVRWHQDASFFHTEPISVATFWFALEDATRGNGCLWAQPGGHRGPLRERFVRAGNVVRMVALDSTPWPDQRDAQPIEVQAGTLVCFHGLLPHWSGANRSPRSRQAYTLHVTDAGCRYASDNWIQRGEKLPVRGLLP